jgi:protein subunit release factor A
VKELHLTRKDFKLEWYSGEGSGGQHRNKHENCCRITHIDSGIKAVGTSSKSRVTNQRNAFNVLAARLIAHYSPPNARREDAGRVRTYHRERNEDIDHASGLSMRFTEVIGKGKVGPLIEARRAVCETS